MMDVYKKAYGFRKALKFKVTLTSYCITLIPILGKSIAIIFLPICMAYDAANILQEYTVDGLSLSLS